MQTPTAEDDAQAALVLRLTALAADADARAAKLAADASATAGAAAGAAAAAQDEASALAAAEAARLAKVYRSWEPRVGEFDACPQVPPPSGMLPYFGAEEGLRATRADLLLSGKVQPSSATLPPRLDASPAATAFSTIGVYRSTGEEEPAGCPLAPSAVTSDAAAPSSGAAEAHTESGRIHLGTTEPPPKPLAGSQERPIDVGLPRTAGGLTLPSIYKQPRAATELNEAYLAREYATMRLNKTASAALVRARGRDGAEFALGCARIDFGEVARGATAARRVPLQNVSLAAARFSVDQAEPPLRLAYPRAAVPAGLKVFVTVELAPSRLQELGAYQAEVVVRSALNIIRCPVSAVFAPAPDAPEVQPGPEV